MGNRSMWTYVCFLPHANEFAGRNGFTGVCQSQRVRAGVGMGTNSPRGGYVLRGGVGTEPSG